MTIIPIIRIKVVLERLDVMIVVYDGPVGGQAWYLRIASRD